jgi:hypothetical protein
MRQKFKTGALFTLLVVAGALTASAVAGLGPLRASQTTTTTVSVSTETATTTTVATATTTTTATTTAPPPVRRVTICHHRFTRTGTKHVTIRILRRPWSAHQRHGDSIGSCRTSTARKFHNKPGHKKKWHKPRR